MKMARNDDELEQDEEEEEIVEERIDRDEIVERDRDESDDAYAVAEGELLRYREGGPRRTLEEEDTDPLYRPKHFRSLYLETFSPLR